MNVICIHGYAGNPAENWFPWLKRELESLGHTVIIPQFSTPENQNLDQWRKEFQEYEHYINEDTVFIGHSLGPAFILSILEESNTKVKGCFFVAGFIGKLNLELDEVNATFTEKKFDWEKIRATSESFKIYVSSDDPHIPLKKGEELASHLNAEVTIIDKAGHFNEAAGFMKFEKLLADIKELK